MYFTQINELANKRIKPVMYLKTVCFDKSNTSSGFRPSYLGDNNENGWVVHKTKIKTCTEFGTVLVISNVNTFSPSLYFFPF